MPASLQISIPTTSTSTTTPAYTIYTIHLTTPLRTTHRRKRYSDFATLHSTLLSQVLHNTPPPAPLPAKSWSLFRSSTTSPQQIEDRRVSLEAYLQAIQNNPDAKWRNAPAFRTFLNLPAQPRSNSPSANGGNQFSSHPNNGYAKPPRADVTIDPNIWLDIHRDVKSALRSARLANTARDQATTAQAQHEAAAEAKRCVVRAGTMIAALDAGLTGLSSDSGDAGARKLGDGEVRRRRDLLASARKEKEAVETALSASVVRAGQQNSSQAGTASVNARDALLGPPGDFTSAQPGSAGTSRRVIGSRSNTATETLRTRELDNTGVLALQQEVMAEQDADVSELTRTVARMREMGVRIGEEVELQNEMLGIVEGDVERVGDKVRTARGRVAKIK